MPDPVTPPAPVTPTPTPTPPAVPPATPAPPATPEPPKIDPFAQEFAKSLGMALGDDITLKPLSPETRVPEPDLPLPVAARTLGEIAMDAHNAEKEAAAAAAAASTAPAAPPPGAPGGPAIAPAAPAPTGTPPAAPPPITVRKPAVEDLAARVTKDVLAEVKKLQTPAAPSAVPAAPATPNAESQWEATLPEANQEELELLRWGEANGIEALKGKATEKATYLRRLEDFARTNPDQEVVDEWITKNEPKLPERVLRKAAEARILKQAKEMAIEEVRRENEPRLAEMEARQRASELRPLVDAASNAFIANFESPGEKTAAGTLRAPPDIAKKLRLEGIEAASETFPIEAPIIHRYVTAAQAMLNLQAGLVPHNPRDPVHIFLENFIVRQEQAILSKPEDQRMVNGKPFLPAGIYYSELSKDPTLSQRYSTLTQADILKLLDEGAHREVNREYAKLAKAGFKRQAAADSTQTPGTPVIPVTPVIPTPPPGVEADSGPRASGSRSPGAAVQTAPLNPNMDFLKKIHPDAERILAQ